MKDLVLASKSPRRRRLMTEAGYRFRVVAPEVGEDVPPGIAPTRAALMLAERKARAVEGGVVLAADTLLDLDGVILGKPSDADDATRILRMLSGRAHDVLSGVAVRRGERVELGLARTRVAFQDLHDSVIEAYVATGEPLDKAGAYAIQGGARGFVARLDGPLDNVVGLPMGIVRRLLSQP